MKQRRSSDKEQEIQSLRDRISLLEEENDNLRGLDRALSRNTALFEALIASSRDGIALTRLDGTIIRIVKSILGSTPTGLSGLPVEEVVHPEDREIIRESYRRLAAGTVQVEHSVRLLNQQGQSVWVEGTVTDMLDNPAVQAVVHNYRDITLRKRHDLLTAEFMAIVENAPFAIFSKTLSGEILTWNHGAQKIFGYTAAEIIGQHVWTLVRPELREAEERNRRSVIECRKAVPRFRTIGLHRTGADLPLELVLAPLITDGRIHGIAHLSYAIEKAGEWQ